MDERLSRINGKILDYTSGEREVFILKNFINEKT
jgi:hypothetical protein